MSYDLNSLMMLRVPVYNALSSSQLRTFSTESIATWLTDPKVRENLLNIRVTMVDYELERNNMQDVKFFDSPHFNSYKEYINSVVLPSYLDYLQRVNPPVNQLTNKVLSYLISASVGNMSIPPDSAGYILQDLFPRMKLVKTSSEGNCYFCSVGYNIGASNQEVRNAIAEMLSQSEDLPFIARRYATSCQSGTLASKYRRDPHTFVNEFPSLVRKSCARGERDCYECIWGGNEYDSFVANAFNRPVVGIQIERKNDLAEINLTSRYGTLAPLIRRYLGIVGQASFKFLANQQFNIMINYIFPEHVYKVSVNMREAFLTDMGIPLAYMYRGNHFNAIDFK